MPGYGDSCGCRELCSRFARSMEGRCEAGLVTRACRDLCGYAAKNGLLLCELDMTGIKGFLDRLYSLESVVFTEEDIRKELRVVTLFYDALREAGCVRANPVRELKAAAVRELAAGLEAKEYRLRDLPEAESSVEEGGRGDD